MTLVFCTWLVGTLWVYSFLGQILLEDLCGSEWSFSWSYFQLSLLLLFILVACLSWRELHFLKSESLYTIKAWSFQIWYFLSFASSESRGYFHFRALFAYLQPFFHVVYPFGFFAMISLFPYFAPTFFYSPHIRLLLCLRPFSL